MNSADLIELSARQFPIDANILHTFGQLLAAVAPLLAIQALGILSVLSGLALVSVVNNQFSNSDSTDSILGFGIISGGVFSSITSQYEKSVVAAANRYGTLI